MTLPQGLTPRIYRVGPWRRALPWLIFGPILLIFAPLLFDRSARGLGLVLVPLMLVIALGVHWLVSYVRLEISPVGVRTRNLGQTVETEWSNVIDVRLDAGRQGFITRAPLEGPGAKRLAAYSGIGYNGVPIYDRGQRILLEERRFIPLDPFAWHFKHGDLVAEVARVAPHLQIAEKLAAAPLPTPPPPPIAPEERRTNRITLLFVVGLIVAVLLVAFLLPGGMDRNLETVAFGAGAIVGGLRSGIGAIMSFRKGTILFGIFQLFFVLVAIAFLFGVIGNAVGKHHAQ